MSSRDDLTELQAMALTFVISYLEANGLPPTAVELTEGLMLNNKTDGYGLFTALMRKGYVRLESGKKRGLTVVKQTSGIPYVTSPINGRGEPQVDTLLTNAPLHIVDAGRAQGTG